MSGSQQEREFMPADSNKEFDEGARHRAVGQLRIRKGMLL